MTESIDYDRLAKYYDALVTTTMDIGFFLDLCTKTGGPVLELMAGSGRVSVPLAKAGVSLTCVDRSPRMLSLLRRKSENLSTPPVIVEADVRDLALGSKFDLVLLPFNSFSELLTEGDQKKGLEIVRQHLQPGGRFVCTHHNPAVRLTRVNGKLNFVGAYPLAGGSTVHFLMTEKQLNDQGLVGGFEYFEEYGSDGVLHEKSAVPLSYCLHTREEFERLAEGAGFRVVELYGDYDCSVFDPKESPFMIWVLTAQTS